MKPMLATLFACLAASGAGADTQRVLVPNELDRVAAGACLAGSALPCNDTPGTFPGGTGTNPSPLVFSPVVPLVYSVQTPGLGTGGCFGFGLCASSSSASSASD